MFLHLIKANSILSLNTIHGVIIPHCIDPLYCFWIFGVMLVFWVLCAQSCPTLCNPMEYSPPGFSIHGILARQEYWSGLSFPSPGYLSSPKVEHTSPVSPTLAGRFFFLTTEPTWETLVFWLLPIILLWTFLYHSHSAFISTEFIAKIAFFKKYQNPFIL